MAGCSDSIKLRSQASQAAAGSEDHNSMTSHSCGAPSWDGSMMGPKVY